MLNSMTGFASRTGNGAGFSWSWEMRSVNGKGLDVRIRVPDWLGMLEVPIRKAAAQNAARGNISVGLRIARDAADGASSINPAALSAVLTAIGQIEEEAGIRGVTLTPASAADVLNARGVMDAATHSTISEELLTKLRDDVGPLMADFATMRSSEGQALHSVLLGQLERMAALIGNADDMLHTRQAEMQEVFKTSLSKLMEAQPDLDEPRLAQELALLAVKHDVTEEIDRLRAHVAAARDLLSADGPVGRKLDFLMQEFNREANTLCSKSQNTQLTEIGLELKVLIDQMREQVQNVE